MRIIGIGVLFGVGVLIAPLLFPALGIFLVYTWLHWLPIVGGFVIAIVWAIVSGSKRPSPEQRNRAYVEAAAAHYQGRNWQSPGE